MTHPTVSGPSKNSTVITHYKAKKEWSVEQSSRKSGAKVVRWTLVKTHIGCWQKTGWT